MSTTEELAAGVAALAGARIVAVGRTVDLAEVGFSRDGVEYVLHAPCPFRMTRGDQILIGSRDMGYPATSTLDPDAAFDSYETKFDRRAQWLTRRLAAKTYVVETAVLGAAGAVTLTITDSVILDLLPACAGPVEQWRLFARVPGGRHYVFPDPIIHSGPKP